jgi:hypothetical protein
VDRAEPWLDPWVSHSLDGHSKETNGRRQRWLLDCKYMGDTIKEAGLCFPHWHKAKTFCCQKSCMISWSFSGPFSGRTTVMTSGSNRFSLHCRELPQSHQKMPFRHNIESLCLLPSKILFPLACEGWLGTHRIQQQDTCVLCTKSRYVYVREII